MPTFKQKAATSCISLIQAFPDKEDMVTELAPIVTEEWGHFRLVLQKRGLHLGHQRKDKSVNALLKFERKGGSRDERLMERLLALVRLSKQGAANVSDCCHFIFRYCLEGVLPWIYQSLRQGTIDSL